mmetsp:Transcript_37692/g.106493  ORF Transcript_37692/g.106493 Transcript_37692/m.106493 type:complete len:241 (-) Transcript_37692:444-1166(-)
MLRWSSAAPSSAFQTSCQTRRRRTGTLTGRAVTGAMAPTGGCTGSAPSPTPAASLCCGQKREPTPPPPCTGIPTMSPACRPSPTPQVPCTSALPTTLGLACAGVLSRRVWPSKSPLLQPHAGPRTAAEARRTPATTASRTRTWWREVKQEAPQQWRTAGGGSRKRWRVEEMVAKAAAASPLPWQGPESCPHLAPRWRPSCPVGCVTSGGHLLLDREPWPPGLGCGGLRLSALDSGPPITS